MNLKNIQLDTEYRNLHSNIVNDFFIPLLNNSITYKRSVGFFSSSALVCFSYGLCRFLENGGKIQLVVTPFLSEEDVKAMRTGYELRKDIVEKNLLGSLKDPQNVFEEERLNLLACLIANGQLDIKVALTEFGMYHEKLGIFEDDSNNFVAFSGSMNESANAFLNNYEVIEVFCSWESPSNRAKKKKDAFERIWEGSDPTLRLFDFPKLSEELIAKYRKSAPKFDMDEKELAEQKRFFQQAKKQLMPNTPMLPTDSDFKDLHEYQKLAIRNWKDQNYRGLFDMATGTGKTITGLAALTTLYEDLEREQKKLFAIIVCPYQHLVEQWVEDIERFNIKPIVGFSTSPQKDWKTRLSNAVVDTRLPGVKKNFFCFACTNATFSSDYVQNQLGKISIPKILIVDEAHNFGAPYLSKWLLDSYAYRIGLSATINRHGDDEGTSKLFDFFGKKCIEYDIERAIIEKKLTPYNYYPVVVSFDDEEVVEYIQITRDLIKNINCDKNGKTKLSEKGKILAMQRARLIAGAKAKIPKLKEKILPYKNDTHILVYCGATKVLLPTEDCTDVDLVEKRQIVQISEMLGNELGITNHHFTSNENASERKDLKDRFTGGNLQSLVAIKCLDEGVNIPKIKTAFILASTTNPKEYIQRRGRVLRRAEGKQIAEIYDFIVLPYDLNKVPALIESQINEVKSLVKRELARAEEFSRIASNWSESNAILEQIKDAYGIRNDLDEVNDYE